MQLEVQEYREQAGPDGVLIEGAAARPVGPIQVMEFGAADDTISMAVGGSYISNWNADFLQKELGVKGECSRYYFDRKIAVDIGDPSSKTAKKKRRLLHENGFGYLCIPENYPQEVSGLKKLYDTCIALYQEYEVKHPRPVVFQDTTIVDETTGAIKQVKIPAIDIKVGGGVNTGTLGEGLQRQKAIVEANSFVTDSEKASIKERTKAIEAAKKAASAGRPFRNPFIGKGVRKYQVTYVS